MDRKEAPASRIGAEIRAARRSLGWEVPQLAQSLRIRQSYLEAIETGRAADLPGTTYALGFVRAYAAALGLDADEVARRFREEAADVAGKPALRFPAPVPRRGVPAGALILLGLVILGAAYAGWYSFTAGRQIPAETVPPIPDRLAAAVEKPAPSPQVASILPGAAPPSAQPSAPKDTTVAATAPAPNATATPGQAAQSPAVTEPRPAGPTAPEMAPPPLPGGPAGASAPPANAPASSPSDKPATAKQEAATTGTPPAGTRIVLKTTADAWITLKQKDGPLLLNKTLHAGDSFPIPATAEGVTLTTGNAGATVLEVDGAPIPQSLGTPGMVRRDLALDADDLKAGKLPPPKPRKPAVKPAAAPE